MYNINQKWGLKSESVATPQRSLPAGSHPADLGRLSRRCALSQMAQAFLCGGSLVERSADLFLVANEVTGQEREGVGNEVKDTPTGICASPSPSRGAEVPARARGEMGERHKYMEGIVPASCWSSSYHCGAAATAGMRVAGA